VTAEKFAIGGRVVRYGVELPPPSGRARVEFCIRQGIQAMVLGSNQYGRALRLVGTHLPKGLRSVPPTYPLDLQHQELQAKSIGRKRVETWFRNRNYLDDQEDAALLLGIRYLGKDWAFAEKSARDALSSAVDAFNWLDDVRQDLEERTPISVLSFFPSARRAMPEFPTVENLVESAHQLAHRTGELVGGLFGCQLVHDGKSWQKECPLSFLHIRLGMSPGMACRYACSICEQDPSECEHELGEAYAVAASRVEGACNICRGDACGHIPGDLYRVRARLSIIEADLREVSLVPRPRDPLARIERLGVDDDRMRQFHGFLPHPESTLLCHDCMYPCTGFS
jgi:hypothetical protein